MLVESNIAVPWTKPADLPFDAKKDLPDFGKAYGAEPLAVLCDGSVRTLDLKKLTPKTLKCAIMLADGELLGEDWLFLFSVRRPGAGFQQTLARVPATAAAGHKARSRPFLGVWNRSLLWRRQLGSVVRRLGYFHDGFRVRRLRWRS